MMAPSHTKEARHAARLEKDLSPRIWLPGCQHHVVAVQHLNGWIVESAGHNCNLILAVTPAFFVLAIVCMLFVVKGEAKVAER